MTSEMVLQSRRNWTEFISERIRCLAMPLTLSFSSFSNRCSLTPLRVTYSIRDDIRYIFWAQREVPIRSRIEMPFKFIWAIPAPDHTGLLNNFTDLVQIVPTWLEKGVVERGKSISFRPKFHLPWLQDLVKLFMSTCMSTCLSTPWPHYVNMTTPHEATMIWCLPPRPHYVNRTTPHAATMIWCLPHDNPSNL